MKYSSPFGQVAEYILSSKNSNNQYNGNQLNKQENNGYKPDTLYNQDVFNQQDYARILKEQIAERENQRRLNKQLGSDKDQNLSIKPNNLDPRNYKVKMKEQYDQVAKQQQLQQQNGFDNRQNYQNNNIFATQNQDQKTNSISIIPTQIKPLTQEFNYNSLNFPTSVTSQQSQTISFHQMQQPYYKASTNPIVQTSQQQQNQVFNSRSYQDRIQTQQQQNQDMDYNQYFEKLKVDSEKYWNGPKKNIRGILQRENFSNQELLDKEKKQLELNQALSEQVKFKQIQKKQETIMQQQMDEQFLEELKRKDNPDLSQSQIIKDKANDVSVLNKILQKKYEVEQDLQRYKASDGNPIFVNNNNNNETILYQQGPQINNAPIPSQLVDGNNYHILEDWHTEKIKIDFMKDYYQFQIDNYQKKLKQYSFLADQSLQAKTNAQRDMLILRDQQRHNKLVNVLNPQLIDFNNVNHHKIFSNYDQSKIPIGGSQIARNVYSDTLLLQMQQERLLQTESNIIPQYNKAQKQQQQYQQLQQQQQYEYDQFKNNLQKLDKKDQIKNEDNEQSKMRIQSANARISLDLVPKLVKDKDNTAIIDAQKQNDPDNLDKMDNKGDVIKDSGDQPQEQQMQQKDIATKNDDEIDHLNDSKNSLKLVNKKRTNSFTSASINKDVDISLFLQELEQRKAIQLEEKARKQLYHNQSQDREDIKEYIWEAESAQSKEEIDDLDKEINNVMNDINNVMEDLTDLNKLKITKEKIIDERQKQQQIIKKISEQNHQGYKINMYNQKFQNPIQQNHQNNFDINAEENDVTTKNNDGLFEQSCSKIEELVSSYWPNKNYQSKQQQPIMEMDDNSEIYDKTNIN